MVGKSALLVGASGLVGGELLNCLLTGPEYSKVLILVRKPLGLKHPKLEELLIEFEDLARYKDFFKVNDVFCCLGTTIRKAGSQEAFKKVDVEYPLEIARLTKEMRAEKFLIISSMGANPKSPVFKQATIFIYCRSGSRSRAAVNMLLKQGYTNVFNLGGIASRPRLVTGAIITVRRCSFISEGEITTHGLALLISAPLVGFRSTQYKGIIKSSNKSTGISSGTE